MKDSITAADAGELLKKNMGMTLNVMCTKWNTLMKMLVAFLMGIHAKVAARKGTAKQTQQKRNTLSTNTNGDGKMDRAP